MGWKSLAVITDYVIIEGPNDGLFVYHGTPASGNLVAWIAAQSGTDPYGNFYSAGMGVEGLVGAGPHTQTAELASGVLTLFFDTLARMVLNNSGLFVYNPGGGAGNLIASLAQAGGTDQYGNTFGVGFETQITATQFIQMSGATLAFANGGASSGSITEISPGILSAQSGKNGGGDTVVTAELKSSSTAHPQLIVVSGTSVSPATSALFELQGGEVANGGIWALAGTASGSPPTGAEVWNDLGSTGLAGDAGSASYRLTAEGELQITVQKTFNALGGVTTATFATTLVSPYIPPAARILVGDPIKVNGGSPGSTTGLHLTGAGAVQLTGLPAGCTAAGCDVRIPLI